MGGGGYGGGSNLGANLHNIDFSKADLVPFEKNFYIEHPDVTRRSEQEAAEWRASKQIVVSGTDVPKPCLTFEEASMPEYILSEVIKCGFNSPTPIQSQGWPMALKGRNTVGVSATGSGKTLAFLLPAMIHIKEETLRLSFSSVWRTFRIFHFDPSILEDLAALSEVDSEDFAKTLDIPSFPRFGSADFLTGRADSGIEASGSRSIKLEIVYFQDAVPCQMICRVVTTLLLAFFANET